MIGTFLASEIRVLTRGLERHGIDAAEMLRSVGINPSLAEQPRARYPFDRVAAAWGRAAEITAIDDLVLRRSSGIADGFSRAGRRVPREQRSRDRPRSPRALSQSGQHALKTRVEKSETRVDLLCSPLKVDAKAVRVLESGRARSSSISAGPH